MLFRDLDLPGWPCMATVGCILASEQLLRLQDTPAIGTIRRRRCASAGKCKRICLGRACDPTRRAGARPPGRMKKCGHCRGDFFEGRKYSKLLISMGL